MWKTALSKNFPLAAKVIHPKNKNRRKSKKIKEIFSICEIYSLFTSVCHRDTPKSPENGFAVHLNL